MRNKFASLQKTVLSKTDIFLLSESKIDIHFQIFNSLKNASKCTVKMGTKIEEDFYST